MGRDFHWAILFCIAAFALLVIIIVRACMGLTVGVLILPCIIAFVGGVILGCMGIVAMYLGKLYLESKDRPKYLIDEEF